ncbi:MAG TPA: hypothetical protein PK657_06060, partial [Legionella sp.]|nr:hypothetical protein [Legionella sp.]
MTQPTRFDKCDLYRRLGHFDPTGISLECGKYRVLGQRPNLPVLISATFTVGWVILTQQAFRWSAVNI